MVIRISQIPETATKSELENVQKLDHCISAEKKHQAVAYVLLSPCGLGTHILPVISLRDDMHGDSSALVRFYKDFHRNDIFFLYFSFLFFAFLFFLLSSLFFFIKQHEHTASVSDRQRRTHVCE